jgi:hypothetical protein
MTRQNFFTNTWQQNIKAVSTAPSVDKIRKEKMKAKKKLIKDYKITKKEMY